MAVFPSPEVVLPRGPMVPASFRVTERRRDTEDTWTLALEPLDPADAIDSAPGQFNMIGVAGSGEVPISISGGPDDPSPLLHTVRAVGLSTAAICAAAPGKVLAVRGPFGRPWPVADMADAHVAIVAGGIGLAPLRPAVLQLLARTAGGLTVLYGGRTPDQLLYREELDQWRDHGAEVAISVDTAGPEWRGRVGVVTRLVERADFDPERTYALICGPEVMMRFAVAALRDRGIPEDRMYVSMERNMQCGIGHCGHCQLGPTLVCRDGPVYRYDELAPWLGVREL